MLGGVGYYREGPDVGVAVCLEGVSAASDRMVDELKAVRTKLFDDEIAALEAGGLRQAPHIQWFHLERRFFPMGVKMVGAFCDAIRVTDLIDPRQVPGGVSDHSR